MCTRAWLAREPPEHALRRRLLFLKRDLAKDTLKVVSVLKLLDGGVAALIGGTITQI